jgi:hypothetical protein
MKDPKEPSTWLIFVYFVLAVLFALFAVIASRTSSLSYHQPSFGFSYTMQVDLHWTFWLLIILSIICLLPLLNAILFQLHILKKLPPLLDKFYKQEADRKVDEALWRLKRRAHSLSGQLIITGIGVFLAVFVISNSNAVRDDEVDSHVYEIVSQILFPTKHESVPTSVAELWFFPAADSRTSHLQDCLKTVEDLKKVGARGALINLRNFVYRPDYFALLKRIEATGIAVFGLPRMTRIHIADSTGKEIELSEGTYSMPAYEVWQDPFLHRIRPIDIRNTFEPHLLDVSLELLRKFHNNPADLGAKWEGRDIYFGDYRLPVTKQGWMYSRENGTGWMNSSGIYAVKSTVGDSIHYKKWQSNRTLGRASAQQFSDAFKDKVVLLSRPGIDFQQQKAYQSVFQSLLDRSFMVKLETGHVWLSLFSILIAGFIAFRFRPLLSILLIFVFGIGVVLVCTYLYTRLNTLIDIFYPLLSICMSMFIFPSITIIKKIIEEEEVFVG